MRHQWVDTVDSILDPIMVHDGEGRIQRANKAYAGLAGIGFPEIIGKPYWECFPRLEAPLAGCANAKCAAAGRGGETLELPGGEVYTSRVFPLRDDGSGMPRALHLFKNVTLERREAESLKARHAQALAYAEALSALAASTALAAGDVPHLAREMTEQVARACNVARVNVWLFNAAETALACVDHFDAATANHTSGMELQQAQFENEFRALKAARYVAADHPLTDPRTAGYAEGYLKPNRITSMLDVVVEMSGRHLGLLCLEHVEQPHHWEKDEIAFAQQAAEKIAIAIANQSARQAEQALRISEEKHRVLFASSQDAFMSLGPPGWNYIAVNPAAVAMFRAAEGSDFRSTNPSALSPERQPDGRLSAEKMHAMIDIAMRAKNHSFDWTHKRLDGEEFPTTVLLTRLDMQDATLLSATVRDITELRRAQDAVERSERYYRKLIEGSSDAFFVVDRAGKLAYRSESAQRLTGYAPDEVIGRDFISWVLPEWQPAARSALAQAIQGPPGTVVQAELRVSRKDGTLLDVEAVGRNLLHDPDVNGIVVIARDLSERRRAELALRASKDLLECVVENAPMRVFWKDANLRFLGSNSAFARDAGLSKPADLIGKDDAQMPWHAQAELYRADDRAVLESDTPKLGFEELQSTPDGRTIWVRTSKVPLHDAGGRTIGILGIYDDITEHKLAEENLRGALAGTVEAMAATVEARDPYTAGHQHRVADLAAAIASEMGLPAETVAGIRFGAMIHDLGKIQVPAELLTKPTKLTRFEFELIKTHAQAGYDIVKRIKFPWRVAEIVHQHHERLDGSGYPQGLKGEAIAIEARIVAVADVVEAMASHRPYRQGLGIDAALKEIEGKKGTWFEPAAVDACLRLFREKNFSLEKASG